ncbi:Rho GTPase-activating protein 7, partial [Striga hermonthica]
NPAKIKAVQDLTPPTSVKGVQALTGRLAALNRFISKSTDRCKPFFEAIKKGKRFEWTEECQKALDNIKETLISPPTLQNPKPEEMLFLYLGVSETAISAVLIREEGLLQSPIYYVSKALHDAELRYPPMEKLAFALVMAARKLRPYFQEHSITVRTSYPLRQILHRPDTSGRMVKWAIELGQFDIHYQPRTAIKAQALSDFIAEFTPAIAVHYNNQPWVLYIDGSSTANRAGAGIVLADPENRLFCHSVKFLFPETNNEAEYEALLSGLKLAESMNVTHLKVFSDSQLLVNQINGSYEVKEPRLTPYLSLAKRKLSKFFVDLEHIPRTLNVQADALSRLASSTGMEGAEKTPSTESIDFAGEEELAVQRLEIAKNDLRQRIAKEARGNAILQASLERRKQALHERRLSLEQDVVRLQEQLQAERDLRAALEVGLSMSSGQFSGSRGMDSKTRAELEEIALAEADVARLKQKVAELHHQLNQQRQHHYVPLPDSTQNQNSQ